MEHKLLWTPTEQQKESSNINQFINFVNEKYHTSLTSYDDIWRWSTDNIELFWENIFSFFKIINDEKISQTLTPKNLPFNEWFVGSKTNYAEHVFRYKLGEKPAIIFRSETVKYQEISWQSLENKVAQLAKYLKDNGVSKGDRVVGYLPNIPEATIAFLAANSLGAIWSSCSPDFGNQSVIDRFEQIEPKVFIFVDGYSYNGKNYDRRSEVDSIIDKIGSINLKISIDYIGSEHNDDYTQWHSIFQGDVPSLNYERVEHNHPIWVLYSSGTTGKPKTITHSGLGIILEHYKYHSLQGDVKKGERFFWYSTTGWMMWNFVQSALLVGSTAVLFDGSPGYPNINTLWDFTEKAKINHFGTSAPYLMACMKEGLEPGRDFDLSSLISIGSTGSPLPPEAFDWVYNHIKSDVWLTSMSGGTDVCTAFVGGNILEPVYLGEIQGRALGCALEAWDDNAQPLHNQVGEMVIKKPMPSMPVFFWNDKGNTKYYNSYFNHFKDIWRHGDWVRITPHNSLIILGRSDATLNRHGIRIGTAEIYNVIEQISEIKDSLIVNLELKEGKHFMPLFVVMKEGKELTQILIKKIATALKTTYTPRHIPDEVIVVQDLPYTISGKKMEAPVKKILMGIDKNVASNVDSMRNPESLDFFESFAKEIKSK